MKKILLIGMMIGTIIVQVDYESEIQTIFNNNKEGDLIS